MKNFYTYAHTKPDGTIFYIGQGTSKYKRAYLKNGRNQHWKNIVAKYGYKVEILAYWDSSEEAKSHEILLISCFKDMGIKLCNLTEGGEGTRGISRIGPKGYKHTPEALAKISFANKNRIYDASFSKIMSKARTGKKHSLETIQKIKDAAIKRESKKRLGVNFVVIANEAETSKIPQLPLP